MARRVADFLSPTRCSHPKFPTSLGPPIVSSPEASVGPGYSRRTFDVSHHVSPAEHLGHNGVETRCVARGKQTRGSSWILAGARR